MKLVTLEYAQIGNSPQLILFEREGQTRVQTVVKDFKPYFYVPKEEFEQNMFLTADAGSIPGFEYKGLLGEDIIKIGTKLPQDVEFERRKYSKTWEDDVRFKTRFLIDRVDKIEPVNLRVQYTDIESCIETNEIISIAVYDNYLDKVVTFVWRKDLTPGTLMKEYSFPSGYAFKATIHKYKSLTEMMSAYASFVKDTDPDIFTGWYFRQFDMPMIISQMERLNLSAGRLSPLYKCKVGKNKFTGEETVECQGRIVWDMMEAYAELQATKLPDQSLEAISQKELKEGKHQHEMSVTEMWEKDISQLIEYNCKDSVLVHRIDKKRHVLEYYDTLRRWTGCGWENLYSNTQMWDIYLLRKVHGKFALPSKRTHNIERITGAEVFAPTPGVHDWICLLDLKSLYPSIIITFNLSPETFVTNGITENCNTVNGISFRREPKGLLPMVLLEMLEERKKYQAEMKKYPFGTTEYDVYFNLQTAVKVHMNALYGAMLYHGFRLATREVGETITYCGRSIINWIRSEVQRLGFKVLYGDTDSVFFYSHGKSLEEIVPEFTMVTEHLNKELPNKVAELGGEVSQCSIKIEAKKVYSNIFMTQTKGESGKAAKKRYAGRAVWEGGKVIDESDIMGFEVRRRNSSKLSRDLQERVLKILMGFEPRENLRACIKNAEAEFKKENPDWELIGVPQGIDDLETNNPHTRGALYANEYLGENFKKGDIPKLVYVCATPVGYPSTKVVCFRTKLPKGFKIDTDTMFEKSILAKLESIFETAGVNVQEIIYGTKTLDSF